MSGVWNGADMKTVREKCLLSGQVLESSPGLGEHTVGCSLE